MAVSRDSVSPIAPAHDAWPLAERLFRGALAAEAARQEAGRPLALAARTEDFPVTGRGDHPSWRRAVACGLQRSAGAGDFSAGVKWLWSDAGLYALLTTEDARLSCRRHADGDDLTDGDVFVLSFLPDPDASLAAEYQINPLGAESFSLVVCHGGEESRWRPRQYGGARSVRKGVTIRGGAAEPGAAAGGWTAELFFPWALFEGLGVRPPLPAEWGLNCFRVDHDGEEPSWRVWSPTPAGGFSAFADAGRLRFEL